MSETRRQFFRQLVSAAAAMVIGPQAPAAAPGRTKKPSAVPGCTLYRAINGSAAENLRKVVAMLGGMETVTGPDDVVVIKPNVQWWNQGAPNLAAVTALVDLAMNRRGGFRGEVVIAENCHRGPAPWKSGSSGWTRSFVRNADQPASGTMNEVCGILKKKYGRRFTACHWIDVGAGGRRVYGPQDGPGYVYCDGTGGVPLITCTNGAGNGNYRATIMSYPVFTTDAGTVVDFKNGIWSGGCYTGRPLRFINVAALNHHSAYCGVSGAVKNYLGISDLSGGPDPRRGGKITGAYYNFHSFPFDKWSHGPVPGMLGAETGVFMNTIRKADLNIMTAEWVGLVSRTEAPVARTRAVLAASDPVALDYHAAKYVLYPNSGIPVHNPDDPGRPLHHCLKTCAEATGCLFDERLVKVQSFNAASKMLQRKDLPLYAETVWGTDMLPILKYFCFRLL